MPAASARGLDPASRFGFRLTATLLVVCVAFGGRSAGTPLSEALMRMLAVGLLLWLAFAPRRAADSKLIIASVLLILATLVAGALQLLPLPEGLWSSLSGGPIAADLLRASVGEVGWRPLTLNIDNTRETLLTLLPPFALFLAVIEMDANDRRRLAFLVLILAALSVVVGLLQFASRTGMYPYDTTHEGYSVGLFSNRNHQADLTLIAALLAAAFFAGRKGGQAGAAGTLVAVALLAVIALNLAAAASRTGIMLAIPAFLLGGWIAFGKQARSKWTLVAAAALVVIAVTAVMMRPDLFAHVSDRFASTTDDTRFEAWPEVWKVIKLYLPLGSGLGTFVPVHQSIENLDMVSDRYLNHAHNDYLEILLEMGVVGVLLVAWFFVLLAWALKDNLLAPAVTERYRALSLAAAGGIAILLAHSVVDYSLRTSTLMAVFALFFAILMPLPEREPGRGRQGRRGSAADEA
jgi:O-antigen ligase